jgi:hypothetical protein
MWRATVWKNPPTIEDKRKALERVIGDRAHTFPPSMVNQMFEDMIRKSGNVLDLREKLSSVQEQIVNLCKPSSKSKKPSHTYDEKVKLLMEWEGIDANGKSNTMVNSMFHEATKRNKSCSEPSNSPAESVALLASLRKEEKKLKKTIKGFNSIVREKSLSSKESFLAKIYQLAPNLVMTESEGGAYAHLRQACLDKLLYTLSALGVPILRKQTKRIAKGAKNS